jgi:predicted permease
VLSGVLLLVCCLNLAGLFTARASLRGRELAIRTALGASRHRLIRQLMTESLLVSLPGGALGIALSLATTQVLDTLFFARDSEGHPLHFDFTLDPSVVLAVLVIVVGVAFGFGLAPAVKWSRISAVETLKRNGSGASRRARPGYWLVGAQAALAVALLSVAGLLLAGAHRLASGMNYEASHVALMRLRPRLVQYTPAKAQAFQHAVLRALGETPGVQSVSLVGTGAVLFGVDARVWRPDWTDPARQALEVGYIDVGARYFATLETPVIAGREFDDRDSLAALPVTIVNEALARRLWPKGQALGAPLIVEGHERHVIGIVSDVPLQARGDPVKPYVYVPYWQNLDQVDARYCIRVAGSPDAILPALARAVHHVDPDVPIAETITLPVQLEGMFTPVRVSAVLLSYAAGLTVVLCAVGLYAAVAYSLSRRTREIGIRSAVGATPWQVWSLVVREGMTVVLAGTLVGYFGALGAAGSVQHLLYGLQDRDWVFYAGPMVLVAAIGMMACWLPARRAAAMDPMAALRDS